jgi:hypothetical protein
MASSSAKNKTNISTRWKEPYFLTGDITNAGTNEESQHQATHQTNMQHFATTYAENEYQASSYTTTYERGHEHSLSN